VAGAASYRLVRQVSIPYFEPSAGEVIASLPSTGAPSYNYIDSTVDLGQWHDNLYYLVQTFDTEGMLLTESTYAGNTVYVMTPGQ
jgi:hypothetical protein